MVGRLFALFVLVPVLDLVLLVTVGERIGFWPTVGIIVLTAAVGSVLTRREGLAAWQRVRAKLATGGVPGPEVIDALLVLLSGALLLTPGFLTDLAGLAGLFPPTRALVRRALRQRLARAVELGTIQVVGGSPIAHRPPSSIEDAEVVDDQTV